MEHVNYVQPEQTDEDFIIIVCVCVYSRMPKECGNHRGKGFTLIGMKFQNRKKNNNKTVCA